MRRAGTSTTKSMMRRHAIRDGNAAAGRGRAVSLAPLLARFALRLCAATVIGWTGAAGADDGGMPRRDSPGWGREDAVSRVQFFRIQEQWRRLSPEERRRLREQIRQWREAAPEERRARRDALRRFEPQDDRQAPPRRDEELRSLTREERRQLRRQILEQDRGAQRRDARPRRRN